MEVLYRKVRVGRHSNSKVYNKQDAESGPSPKAR
jgi:hypothetical protein